MIFCSFSRILGHGENESWGKEARTQTVLIRMKHRRWRKRLAQSLISKTDVCVYIVSLIECINCLSILENRDVHQKNNCKLQLTNGLYISRLFSLSNWSQRKGTLIPESDTWSVSFQFENNLLSCCIKSHFQFFVPSPAMHILSLSDAVKLRCHQSHCNSSLERDFVLIRYLHC